MIDIIYSKRNDMKLAIFLSAMTCFFLLNTKDSYCIYQQKDGFDYYNNRTHRITIGYPQTWNKVNSPGTIFAAVNETSDRSVNIVIVEPERRSLKDITSANQRELKRNIPSIQQMQEKSGNINGINYTVTEYRLYNPSLSGNMFLAIYCFVENRKAYIVTFSSEYNDRHKFKSEMEDMISTLTII